MKIAISKITNLIRAFQKLFSIPDDLRTPESIQDLCAFRFEVADKALGFALLCIAIVPLFFGYLVFCSVMMHFEMPGISATWMCASLGFATIAAFVSFSWYSDAMCNAHVILTKHRLAA